MSTRTADDVRKACANVLNRADMQPHEPHERLGIAAQEALSHAQFVQTMIDAQITTPEMMARFAESFRAKSKQYLEDSKILREEGRR